MSKGKSIRILALFALAAAVGYALVKRCDREQPGTGGAGSSHGTQSGSRSGSSKGDALVLLRETGAAWYCEGDTIKGAWDKAQDALRAVAEHEDATPQDLVNLASVKLKLFADDTTKQNAETAAIQELCREALERDPKLATAHFVLGAIAMDRENDFDAAKQSFAKAVENAPNDVPSKLRWADALSETGERDKAIEVYRSVRDLGPEFAGAFHMTATYRLARLLRQRKQGDDLDQSKALTQEHSQRTAAGASNPSDEEIKLGTLGKVMVPRATGIAGSVPASAPAIKLEPLPPLLADRLAVVDVLEVADVDGDQREDVLASGRDAAGAPSLWMLRQDEKGAFQPVQLGGATTAGPWKRVLAVDLENEFGVSVLLAGDSGLALLSPSPDGSGGWIDGTSQLPQLPAVSDVVPVDFGHDGHLDLAFATAGGLKLVRNDGVPRDQYTRERTGAVALKDVSAESEMPTGAIAWVAIEDFDSDQDIDLLCGGPAHDQNHPSRCHSGTSRNTMLPRGTDCSRRGTADANVPDSVPMVTHVDTFHVEATA